LVTIQCSDGNWNANEYMRGLANGLLLAMSVFNDKNPQFKQAPRKRVRLRGLCKIDFGLACFLVGLTIGAVSMKVIDIQNEEAAYKQGREGMEQELAPIVAAWKMKTDPDVFSWKVPHDYSLRIPQKREAGV